MSDFNVDCCVILFAVESGHKGSAEISNFANGNSGTVNLTFQEDKILHNIIRNVSIFNLSDFTSTEKMT